MHDDFATEPVPGLPGHLPPGEVVLWQGRPDTWRLAREAFALDWFAAYSVLLVLWRASIAWSEGGAAQAVAVGLPYAALGLIGAGVIWWLARAQARATLYTITTQRVAMRIGAALTLTLNLPFAQIEGAALDLPGPGAEAEAWHAYVHLRDNPAGESHEWWVHDPCATWLRVTRDTVSHAVHTVAEAAR